MPAARMRPSAFLKSTVSISRTAVTRAAMIATAGLAWTVEQHPLEAVLGNPEDGGGSERVPVPRVVANVRSDTRAVLGVVGEGYEPLQNGAAFAFCDGTQVHRKIGDVGLLWDSCFRFFPVHTDNDYALVRRIRRAGDR